MRHGAQQPQCPSPLLSVGGKDWKTQTKPFYEFKRRKELDGGAVAERCCYAMRGGVSAIRRDGNDAIVIFGVPGKRVFKVGQTT